MSTKDPWSGSKAGPGTLGRLPRSAVKGLLDGATVIDVPKRTALMRRDGSPLVYAVLSGCVRVDMSSSSGRQTLHYAREGDLVGLARMMLEVKTITAESVTPATVAVFPPRRFREVMDATPSAWEALAAEFARWYLSAMRGPGRQRSESTRVRVARHLIELAVPDDRGELVANVTHQELADAVGTAREVVTRVLGEYRDDGLVRTSSGAIALLKPEKLGLMMSPVAPA